MPRKRKQMSQEDYAATDGANCPYCRSENVTGGSFTAGDACQEVQCDDCGRMWWDTYKLTGYMDRDC